MKTYVFAPAGDAFQITCMDRDTPSPGPGQVRVRMKAASLNYRDLIHLRKQAGRNVAGKIPLSDGAGEVTAVGEGVTSQKVGDRVAGCFFPLWKSGPFDMIHHRNDLGGSLDGVLTEEAILSADSVVAIPEHLSFEEASCLPCAGVTAWNGLVTRGHLQAGQTILTLGTGGVSTFALQFGLALGAKVIITSSSEAKLARAKSLGATAVVNYRDNPTWEKDVYKLTEGKGVDHVIEVGGAGTLPKSLACVGPSGHIAMIGVLTGFGPPAESLFPLVGKNASMSGIYVGSRADFEAMNRLIREKNLKPTIDRTFSFSQAADALEYLATGSHFGKVVIQIS
ncbi:NAD(P)-dependent alcohol dehydrogenase [bacterium]|jgi:NADPH:quinone reductase-like Zn-dependent oxidoreductase|nr:NAD(P)-dependent alcohol dehydrogenase [bacterium]